MIQGAGYRGGEQLKEAFKYFSDPKNFNSLDVMKVDQRGNQAGQESQNLLKVEEVVNGYTSFGFKNEATQLNVFLQGIGERQDLGNGLREAVFTPQHILNYEKLIQKKAYMQDPNYIKFFFKSMSSDG